MLNKYQKLVNKKTRAVVKHHDFLLRNSITLGGRQNGKTYLQLKKGFMLIEISRKAYYRKIRKNVRKMIKNDRV